MSQKHWVLPNRILFCWIVMVIKDSLVPKKSIRWVGRSGLRDAQHRHYNPPPPLPPPCSPWAHNKFHQAPCLSFVLQHLIRLPGLGSARKG